MSCEIHEFILWQVDVRISRVEYGLYVLLDNRILVSDNVRLKWDRVIILVVVRLKFYGRFKVFKAVFIKSSKLN